MYWISQVHNDQHDDHEQCQSADDQQNPAKPLVARLLVLGSFLDVLMGVHRVGVSYVHVFDDLQQLLALLGGVHVQRLRD